MSRYATNTGAKAEAIGAEARAASKRCPRCDRLKPVAQFYRSSRSRDGLQGWCKQCSRLSVGEYRQTDLYRAWKAAYRGRPEVREKDRVAHRAPASRARNAARARSVRGRLVHTRWYHARQLRDATDPARIAHLEALIAAYDREIARIDPRAHELPAMPPAPTRARPRAGEGGAP